MLALRQRKASLLGLLVQPPWAIHASVVERFGTCGKTSCSCHRGQKHGRYYYLTQGVAKRHVRSFLITTAQAQRTARQAVASFNDFYDVLGELSQINAELFRRGEPLNGSST